MSNIIIPPKINVGFQNRKDTYTGKLAYVIYFDDKGKLHKEPSWSGWRDKKIPNEVFENKPLEGFVLNKKVGGYKSGWDFRQTYARVYDPRGFEFEITVENLLWILESNNCIKGKGLEGEYIYGWDGGDLVLVPISSPDYAEIKKKNEIRQNNDFIKAKDLIVGATYRTLQDELLVYLGRYKYYNTTHSIYLNTDLYDGYIGEVDNLDYYYEGKERFDSVYLYKDCGFQYYFAKLDGNRLKPESWYCQIHHWRSLPKKFIECVDSSCHPDYKGFFETEVECKDFFSPIDISKNEIHQFDTQQFKQYIESWLNSSDFYRKFGVDFFYIKNDKFCPGKIFYDYKQEALYIYKYQYFNQPRIYISLEELLDKYKPCYGIQYLMNGKEYRRIGFKNGK